MELDSVDEGVDDDSVLELVDEPDVVVVVVTGGGEDVVEETEVGQGG